MAYVIVDSTNRIKSFGGVVLTFETEEAALASDDAGAKVLPLGEALQAERKMHAEALYSAHSNFVELKRAVEKHLDAVDGAMDEDEFIEEHRELAEAIGYEFEVTEDIEVRLTVSVTKKRGRDIDEDDLDIQVDASYGTFTVNDTAWEIR